MNDLKKLIREVPDYPKPGILFYDLTTLLKDKEDSISSSTVSASTTKVTRSTSWRARGARLQFSPALAYRLAQASFPFAAEEAGQPRRQHSTRSSTARTRSNFTKTP